MNQRLRFAAFTVVALVFSAAVFGLASRHAEEHGSFKAFYCAGKAVALGRDPYRVEPLRSCERAVAGRWLDPGEVEPAPLPGYALAPYAALSRLPFTRAAAVYDALAVAAAVATAALLAGMTGVPGATLLIVLMPLALLNIAFGESPVFTTFGIALAGWASWKRHWAWAAVGAAIALIQPHVGFAVLLALVILTPRARVPSAIAVALLVASSFALLGAHVNVEYLRSVLPAQALSELAASDQYSLSHIWYMAGAPAGAAIFAGEISTLVMIAAGIIGGRVAAKRLNAPGLEVMLPPAAVMLGGVYLHDIQLVAALPAAILVAARSERARRIVAWLTLCALAVVWSQRAGPAVLTLDVAVALAASLVVRSGATLLRKVGAGAALGALAIAAIIALHARPASASPAVPPPVVAGNVLAPEAWAAYLRDTPVRTTETRTVLLGKLPSWLGLTALVVMCIVPPLGSRSRVSLRAARTDP